MTEVGFPRSEEFLRADGFRSWFVRVGVVGAVLLAWLAWFFLAEIPVLETSTTARVEAARLVHSLESPMAGRVATVRAELGQAVNEGDLVFELDSEEESFELAEAESRLASLRTELELLHQEIGLEQERLAAELRGAVEATKIARSRAEIEEVDARYSLEELDQVLPLQEAGLVSVREFLRLQAAAERSATEAEVEQLNLSQLEVEQAATEKSSLALLLRLRRQATATAGEIEDLEAHFEHLTHRRDERSLRAPVGGRVGWLSTHQLGAYVEEGERLAEIVPDGDLRVVAHFPATSVGRLRRGQMATLRLDAYPWAHFGTLQAEVERVATESEDGRIRAELTIVGEAPPSLVLEHGLTGSVEVEVERLAPALLVLRAAGDTLRVHRRV